MTRLSGSTIDWLVDALGPARARGTWSPGTVPPVGLADAAAAHGVEGWVLAMARARGAEVPGLESWAHGAAARHQRAMADLRLVSGALDAAQVPFLVVKGPAVVATCHAGQLLRSYVDLDVVVRPHDLPLAARSLRACGVQLLDANWPLLEREGVQELRFLGPTGGPVDLHWSLGYARPQSDRSPTVSSLLARSIQVDLGSAVVRTLDPVDTVVHLAAHAAESGGNRLVWLADLRGALQALGPSGLESIPVRAAEWHVGPAVQLMLRRTQQVLGVDLPTDHLRKVGGRGVWRGAASLSDRLWAPERVIDAPSPGRLLARAAAASQGVSTRVTVGKVWRRLRDGGGGPLSAADGLFDANDPSSPLYHEGGHEGEEHFFASVLSHARDSRD